MVKMKSSTFVILILVVSFLLRLGAVFALRDWHEGPSTRHGADGVEFNQLAEHLARGEGYVSEAGNPTSFRAPGFPIVLAGVYKVCGHSFVAAYVSFCVLGALSCVLTYLLARELLPESGGRLAAILATIYVPHIYFATTFSSETVCVPTLACSIWLFLCHLRTQKLGVLMLGGLCLGWTALTRPFALLVCPFLLAILVVVQLRRQQLDFSKLAVWVVSFCVVVFPWTFRNYRVFGKPVLVATNGGSTFYGGNNDRVVSEPRRFGAWITTLELPQRELVDAARGEAEHDSVEWRLGLDWVRTHLSVMPKLLLFKFVRLWLPELDSPNKRYTLIQVVGYTPFLLLYLLGFVHCLRARSENPAAWWALHLTVLSTVLTALIFWGSPRFRDANMPLLMVYASVGLTTLLCLIQRRELQPAVA